MLLSMFKYFTIILGSLYTYSHIGKGKKNQTILFLNCLVTTLCTPVIWLIRSHFSILTIPCIILLLCSYFALLYKKNFITTMRTTIISVSMNYILYCISLLFFSPIALILYYFLNQTASAYILKLCLYIGCSSMHCILIILLFSLNRIKNSFYIFENSKLQNYFIFGSLIVLLISSLFFFQKNTSFIILFTLLFFTLAFGILLYLWWRHNITTTYMQKVTEREIDIAEHTIEKQKLEIEKLSKIIHKDNKLLSAMELSVKSLCENPTPAHKEHLLTELDFLSKERSDTLNHYEGTSISLPKTNVFSIDMIIDYLHKKALDENIHFDVALMGNISFLVSDIVDEHDLGTLLSDLGENAIHATSGMKNRQILLSMGVRENVYYLSIYDSGSSFSPKVIEYLGQKRYTTRKAEGGSGIGLMTTIELSQKYMASFELEELPEDTSYTKCISIIWDEKKEIRIKSPLAKQYEINSTRNDIIFV